MYASPMPPSLPHAAPAAAGSERPEKSRVRGAQLAEAQAINSSLSALGTCMNAVATAAPHIPYRDAKLTRLLQASRAGRMWEGRLVTGSESAASLPVACRTASAATRARRSS